MFRLALRPSPFSLALGMVVVAFWALLWFVCLTQVLRTPEKTARQPGPVPELARPKSGPMARAI